MKVQITATVEIDPEAYELTYGLSSADEIRRDVKASALALLNDRFTYNDEIGVK